MKKTYLLPIALGLVLNAGVASATFINGTISFSDGFDTLPSPPPPTTSIVSGLTAFDVNNTLNVLGVTTGDFDAETLGLAFDFPLPPPNTDPWFTTDNFSFTLVKTVVASNTLSCDDSGLCTDSVTINVDGVVSSSIAGLDATVFLGTWTADGTCLESSAVAGACGSTPSASWNVSLVA